MKIYILSHISSNNFDETEFYVDGVFSSMEKLNEAKSRIENELPRIINSNDSWTTVFKISEHELNKVFDDSKLSYWNAE